MEENQSLTITQESTFTGGAFANFFIKLAANIVSAISLGFAYPAMKCWKMRWKAEHTFINGKQTLFDGKALQFFGLYIKWVLLSIITFGVYYTLCARVSAAKWETKHTHFAGEIVAETDKSRESRFDGRWYRLMGVNWLTRFVSLITIGIGAFWAHCYKERWYAKHKTIDGYQLYFDGKGMQYFGKRIVWGLLTAVTLGIYVFWKEVKTVKWHVSHTHVLSFGERFPEPSPEEIEAKKKKSAKVLGILSIVFAGLIYTFAVSLVLSIIGLVRSVKLKYSTGKTLNIIGLCLACVVILAIVIDMCIFAVPVPSYNLL